MSQWGARQREKGLCCKCTRPIAPHSKSRCEVHLQKLRDEDKRPRKGGRRILSAEAPCRISGEKQEAKPRESEDSISPEIYGR